MLQPFRCRMRLKITTLDQSGVLVLRSGTACRNRRERRQRRATSQMITGWRKGRLRNLCMHGCAGRCCRSDQEHPGSPMHLNAGACSDEKSRPEGVRVRGDDLVRARFLMQQSSFLLFLLADKRSGSVAVTQDPSHAFLAEPVRNMLKRAPAFACLRAFKGCRTCSGDRGSVKIEKCCLSRSACCHSPTSRPFVSQCGELSSRFTAVGEQAGMHSSAGSCGFVPFCHSRVEARPLHAAARVSSERGLKFTFVGEQSLVKR